MSTIFRKFPKAGAQQTRFADVKASSYDAKARTVEAVLSAGTVVRREYGNEKLEISRAAVDLSRLETCGIPLLDSHQITGLDAVLGRVASVSFESGKLVGVLAFDDSEAGRKAEGLVSRGTVRGISIGYSVSRFEITDEDGNVIDPDKDRMAWGETYTFTAKRFSLLECSIVSVPADSSAYVRSAGSFVVDSIANIKARMLARHAIATRDPDQIHAEPKPRLLSPFRYPRKAVWRG